MDIKIIIIALVLSGLVLIGGFAYYSTRHIKTPSDKLYLGPVPEGHDLKHFRQTGETIEEVKE